MLAETSPQHSLVGELNEMLTAIAGHSELVLHRLRRDDLNREPIEEIHRAVERSSRIIERMESGFHDER
jgi:signal transduction histidine kinase